MSSYMLQIRIPFLLPLDHGDLIMISVIWIIFLFSYEVSLMSASLDSLTWYKIAKATVMQP